MSKIRPIKSEVDYEAALERIDSLMDRTNSQSAVDELDVLVTLVESYEEKHFDIPPPDPVEAIKFRMEQAGLSQSDLVKYIGSRAKVSEVLSGKRPLTLKMVRALNVHLGIPADVLVKERQVQVSDDFAGVDWSKFPVAQMAKLGWVKNARNIKARSEAIMRDLIERAGGADCLPIALYRKSNSARRNARMDAYALQAWCLYVLAEARANPPKKKFKKGSINSKFLRDVAQLSIYEDGPKRAQEFLRKYGIVLIYARHLPKTYLDGAAMRTKEGVPVIGMTLRYDRIDNFWFCLLHELVHIGRHLSDEITFFVDDLSLSKSDHDEDWDLEEEADQFAQTALIPEENWANHAVQSSPTPMNVIALAQETGVHPAIVAGRVRKETGNYRLLTQFVGNGEVRRHFE